VDRIGTRSGWDCCRRAHACRLSESCCAKLGIARSTLRQALVALGQSGHLRAIRGRGGGTFVVDDLPPAAPPADDVLDRWRTMWDHRIALEVGVAVLACKRARPGALRGLGELLSAMEVSLDDFATYRQLDVRFHIGLAETTEKLKTDHGRDGGAGQRDPADRADRAPGGGVELLQCAAPAQSWQRSQAAMRARPHGRWPSTCAGPNTSSPACCRRVNPRKLRADT